MAPPLRVSFIFFGGIIFLTTALFYIWAEEFSTLSSELAKASAGEAISDSKNSTPFHEPSANVQCRPPQAPPSFLGTPSSIMEDIQYCIETSRELYNSLEQDVNETKATFENVLLPIANLENLCGLRYHIVGFYKSVTSNTYVHNASIESMKMIESFERQSCQHSGIFRLVSAVAQRGQTLLPEQQHFLDDRLRCFRQHGLHLNPSEQTKYNQIQTRLSELQYAYEENLKHPPPTLEFSRAELEGVSDEWLSIWKLESDSKGDNLFKIPLGRAEVSLVLRSATGSHTRERVYVANENKNHENAAIFAEIVNLRNDAARIAGFQNHADGALVGNMVRSFRDVDKLLWALKQDLNAAGQEEIAFLKEVKRIHLEEMSETFSDSYQLWDHHFYSRLQANKDAHTNIDALVSAYFPLEHVLRRVMQMVARLFGIRFEGITESKDRNGIVWHEDVRLFAVWDDSDAVNCTEPFLGYLYLDLFSRAGKFGGRVANFLLQPGFTFANGTRWYPVTAILSNFARPTISNQANLQFDDLIALFHEFGHAVHNLVSKTTFSRFHGTRVARDFVEIPSLLLESWCWEESILHSISSPSLLSPSTTRPTHNNNVNTSTSSISPFSLLQNFINAKRSHRVLSTLQQIHFATFDMAVHQIGDSEALNTTSISKLYNRLQRQVVGLNSSCVRDEKDDWGHGYANFGHLVSGYYARYYGYI